MPTPLLIGSNEFIYFNEKPIKYNNKIIPKKIKGSQEFNTEFNQVFNQEFYYVILIILYYTIIIFLIIILYLILMLDRL
jgi:hypothetical protein